MFPIQISTHVKLRPPVSTELHAPMMVQAAITVHADLVTWELTVRQRSMSVTQCPVRMEELA